MTARFIGLLMLCLWAPVAIGSALLAVAIKHHAPVICDYVARCDSAGRQ